MNPANPESDPLRHSVASFRQIVLLILSLGLQTAEAASGTAPGGVLAWGYNGFGQTTIPAGLTGVTAIAAGGDHTVALKNDGTVVAWGHNGSGQTTIPAGLTGVTAIAAGSDHTVALKNDGTVVAWGRNGSGQTTIPAGLTGVTAIAAGGNHTVVLKNDGTVVAWGYNFYGQTTIPEGLTGVTAIAAGGNHTIVLKTDGTVVAWGYNLYGQTTISEGRTGVTAIAAGGSHNALIVSRVLQISATSGNRGSSVTLPITLNAQGDENALSFSLSFPPSQATFAGVVLGSGLPTASLFANTNQASSGVIGVVVSLPVGALVPKGTQTVVTVTLNLSAGLTGDTTVPIRSAVSPAPRSVSDALGNELWAVYWDGSVTVSNGVEGDVAPRSNGNGTVNAGDIAVMGRIVTGLESGLSDVEVQRADCAPRASFGNGAINAADLTQIARYVAGLDPQTLGGGPAVRTASFSERENSMARKSTSERQLRVVNTTTVSGDSISSSIQAVTQGDENALSFSLSFNPGQMVFEGATLGTDAAAASLVVNTNQAAIGRIGVVLSLPVNQTFKAGTIELLRMALGVNGSGSAAVGFADSPAPMSASDFLGNELAIKFTPGEIAIVGTPSLIKLSVQGTRLIAVRQDGNALSSADLEGLAIQVSSDLVNWSTLQGGLMLTDESEVLEKAIGKASTARFYRVVRH